MSPAPAAADGFTLTYDPARHQLRATWVGTIADAELYAHYAELMALAEAHGGCRFWLLDVMARNISSSAFGRWFGNEFAPLAHAAFGRPLFLAFALGRERQGVLDSPGAQAMQHSCAAYDVYPLYFDTLDSAQEWLAHQQAHDAETRYHPVGSAAPGR